jgi:hypothetical protein
MHTCSSRPAAGSMKHEHNEVSNIQSYTSDLDEEIRVQVVADVVYSDDCDLVLLVAAVRATASMSRNLPTSATGFMTAHIPHLDDEVDDAIVAEPLPQSIKLLFDVAVRSSSACVEADRSQPCTVHANVAKSAMGLLADLAANDEQFRLSLQGKYAVKAWIGV